MEDLSLHILDIVENSIRANAKNIRIEITENLCRNTFILKVSDDGTGMDKNVLGKAIDPFFTTKDGKKVGLGLSLLAQSAEEAGGNLKVESEPGKGTCITATFQIDHIDRKPEGDINETIRCLKAAHPDINFTFSYTKVVKEV
jgi:signal transduction histidine kinase